MTAIERSKSSFGRRDGISTAMQQQAGLCCVGRGSPRRAAASCGDVTASAIPHPRTNTLHVLPLGRSSDPAVCRERREGPVVFHILPLLPAREEGGQAGHQVPSPAPPPPPPLSLFLPIPNSHRSSSPSLPSFVLFASRVWLHPVLTMIHNRRKYCGAKRE